jgi:hypothetical protein
MKTSTLAGRIWIMALTLQLSDDAEAFVSVEVTRGAAVYEADFLAKALDMHRHLRGKHNELHAQVQESLAQYERGEARPRDTLTTQAEARRRFSQTR